MNNSVSISNLNNFASTCNGMNVEEFVEKIRDIRIHGDVKDNIEINRTVATYISNNLPAYDNHEDLVAEFNDYEFDNDTVNFEKLLDDIRRVYSVDELMEHFKNAGMTDHEVSMIISCIYEENFLLLIGGEGHLYLSLRFHEICKKYASKTVNLYWRDGFFFTQV